MPYSSSSPPCFCGAAAGLPFALTRVGPLGAIATRLV